MSRDGLDRQYPMTWLICSQCLLLNQKHVINPSKERSEVGQLAGTVVSKK